MYLFFDTETTGLPRRWGASVTETDNWPRMVQLAWIMCDEAGNRLESRNAIVKPEGYTIPEEVSRLHGITTAMALKEGLPLQKVLEDFAEQVEKAHVLVGHNISFDECIVGAEFERMRMMTSLFLKPKRCTMHGAMNYCRLPGKRGFKRPKLSELHRFLFGEDFDNAHNAMADVDATVRCFWELKSRGVIL